MKTAYCFDLDGTLSTTEILPCLASELGVADEIATLTRATMDGHIGFEASFRLRCLILNRIPLSRVHEIIADIPLHPAILEFIHGHIAFGVKQLLVSSFIKEHSTLIVFN